MEFPSLGTNCGVRDCKILDFLPIICEHCKVTFCREHFQTGLHLCKEGNTLSKDSNSSVKNFLCSSTGCSTKDVAEMKCVQCQQHFCLTHRYHQCFELSYEQLEEERRKLQLHQKSFQETHLAVSSKIDAAIEKCKLSSKKQETAYKVQIMRLKNKAMGESGVPPANRVYLLAYLPLTMQGPPKPVYVSKDWSVGRVVDEISSLCGVPNKNNVATAVKLRMFLKKDGSAVETDMSTNLSNLLDSQVIQNGESVILEYMSPDRVHDGKLKCLDDYK